MHILITGGAGFIGSHLVDLMLRQGHLVHVVDDLSSGRMNNIAVFLDQPRFRFSQADIVTWDGLGRAVQWADRIYHLAAVVGVRLVLEDPIRVLSTNIAGTTKLLRAVVASGWKPRMILASSSEVYGFNDSPRFAESADLVFKAGSWSRWSYAATKLVNEHLAHAYMRQYDLPNTVVRLFNTIGPRQRSRYGMVVPNFVKQAVRGLPITVFGDGKQSRSFCDVRDTVQILDLLAASNNAVGAIVNVGNDQEISIKALAELVRDRAGTDSDITFKSYMEAYGEDFDDVSHRRPDLTELNALIDYKPSWTLTSTIDDLIAYEKHRVI
jgi:UDP-glucose 4-epimerase